MSGMTESASYATEVVRLLWPEPWQDAVITRRRAGVGTHTRDAYVFPSARRPRLLMPVDVPASASMVRRLGRANGGPGAAARSVLEASIRSRAFALTRWPVLRVTGGDRHTESIETHLADVLGTPVRIGVLLGTRRPNQKPVLEIYAPDGTRLGFAKVGHNDLTAELVRGEARSLATVGELRPTTFRVPELLHHGSWAGLEVVVMSALSTDLRRSVSEASRLAAMGEVARLGGTTSTRLEFSAYWTRLRTDVAASGPMVGGTRLHDAVDAIEQMHGQDVIEFGRWHGDWGAWNMGLDSCGVLQLWDWERHDGAVPVGFDALHYAVQTLRPGKRDATLGEADLVASVPALLSELDVPADRHDLILHLYLLEIATRYAEAMNYSDSPHLRRRTDWVLTFLERQLGHTRSVLEGRS